MALLGKTRQCMARLLFIMIMAGFMVTGAQAQTLEVQLVPVSFTEIAEKVSPVVVNVKTVTAPRNGDESSMLDGLQDFGDPDNPFYNLFERFFGSDDPMPGMGSGFIWDAEGYVVTNYHVVEDATEIMVAVGEDEYTAELVGSDPNTDLVLLKITLPEGVTLPAAVLGDSDAMKIGEWVVAIGSPFGLEKTVTAGIVSAKGRVIGFGPYEDYIQTDASINPGNSGGPLINMQGEVIGINTAIIASGQGLGFAIPINMAKKVITELKENGEVTRGWLGVLVQDITPEIAEYYGDKNLKGVMLSDVYAGHPAAEGGLLAEDIVLEINGVKIDSARKLTAEVAGISVGETAEVKVLRNDKEMIFKIKVGKRDEGQLAGLAGIPDKSVPPAKDDAYGLILSDLTPELAKKHKIEETAGVLITNVKSKSAAAKAGLRVGDVIKEVNRQKVATVAEYNKIVKNLKKDEALKLFIWRVNEGFRVFEIKK